MRRFQAIIGLIALVVLGAQTLRHAYVLYVEPRESVLDKYEPAKQDITKTKSLEELITLYEAAREKVAVAKKKSPQPSDEDDYTYDYRHRNKEPFKSEILLREAVREWESHNQQLSELHFFWAAGIAVSIVGAVLYLRIQRWAGVCVCILGTLEMIWATSPSFRTFGSPVEFERLLTFKLIYSAIAFLIVCIGWTIAAREISAANVCSRTAEE